MQESSDLPSDVTSGEPRQDQPTPGTVAQTQLDPAADPDATQNAAATTTANRDPNQDPGNPANFHEESLGERSDGGYKTTFHVFKNDQQVAYYLERIYDMDGKMVRMVKRSADGRSETRFDPGTGDIERIFEAYTLPDGNHLSKEKRYMAQDNTTESVLVVCPRGGLVRAVVREAIGLVNVFQGQTEFSREGHATVSINHWFDHRSTKMTMREQIQWLPGGERGVTEHFYFAEDGGLLNYHKLLYHPGSDRFLEEVHVYEPLSQRLRRKEIKSFDRNADMADMEVTTFDASGAVIERAKNVVSRAQLARSA
jgi:hypothetical protein